MAEGQPDRQGREIVTYPGEDFVESVEYLLNVAALWEGISGELI